MDKDKENQEEKTKEEEKDMVNFTEFLQNNKEKINKIVEANTKRNAEGFPVISKDDPWRKETEWDEHYKCLAKDQ